MSVYQITCPACHAAATVSEDQAGGQVNCLKCHQVFTVRLPTAGADAGLALALGRDAGMQRAGLDHYGTLAGAGVTSESSLTTIQRVEAEDCQTEAYEALSKVQSRLAADLLMYPLWQEGGARDGSEQAD